MSRERCQFLLIFLYPAVGAAFAHNTNRLAQLCATVTRTYLVGIIKEIQPSWIKGQPHIGITAGASTAEQTINEVVMGLQAMT